MLSTGFKLTDTDESFTVLLEEGQAVIRPGFPTVPDLVVELSSEVWQELVLGLTSALGALAAGRLTVGAGALHLPEFSRRFSTGVELPVGSTARPGRSETPLGTVPEN